MDGRRAGLCQDRLVTVSIGDEDGKSGMAVLMLGDAARCGRGR
jgi:hypothetical protein